MIHSKRHLTELPKEQCKKNLYRNTVFIQICSFTNGERKPIRVNNKRTFIQSKLSVKVKVISKQKQIGKKLNNIHFNVAKSQFLIL